MLPLLARVPVLPCLLTRQLFQDRQQDMFSLLDWISAQVNTCRSFYYINTSETPGELSGVNMIIIITYENNMLLPLLWLHIFPLKYLLDMFCCMIEPSTVLPQKSLVMLGNIRQSSEIFGKC